MRHPEAGTSEAMILDANKNVIWSVSAQSLHYSLHFTLNVLVAPLHWRVGILVAFRHIMIHPVNDFLNDFLNTS
jgi:hypothetical protein